jgi:hypothetical protein
MVVLHRQQIGLTGGEPPLGHGPLTLWAVPIATGVVRDLGVAAARAALDVSAERRRAALLDRRHDLELAETQMSGLLPAPRRSVVAEDVRNLQGLPRHGRAGSGARRIGQGQTLQRTGDRPQGGGGHLGIERRGLQLLVPEQHLNDADVLSVLQQIGGKAVP